MTRVPRSLKMNINGTEKTLYSVRNLVKLLSESWQTLSYNNSGIFEKVLIISLYFYVDIYKKYTSGNLFYIAIYTGAIFLHSVESVFMVYITTGIPLRYGRLHIIFV